MDVNALPTYDQSDNETGCCPRFNPEGWDGQDLHFQDKLFARAKTRSFFHIPLNMGPVFKKTFEAIQSADALADDDVIVMSRDPSPWVGEHYFSVSKDTPGVEMTMLSGDFETKVFEGPYKDVPKWEKEFAADLKTKGKDVSQTYYFYTTCPKCAKHYGKNYVVALAQTGG